MKNAVLKNNLLLLFLLFSYWSLPISGQAQSARDNFSKAKYALEEANLSGCLTYLERCESQLGGSNVRIEALRAQCYSQMDEWVKARIAFRNFYSMMDIAERGGETWEKMVDLGRDIDAGLEAQENAFKKKKEDEKKKNLQQVEQEIAQYGAKKEEKKTILNEKNDAKLYQAAVDTRDLNALSLYKEQSAEAGISSRANKIDEELDKHKNPNKYLVAAVLEKNRKEAAYLIGRGGDKNLKNRDGNSLLHLTVDIEDEAMLKMLLEKGANLEIKNKIEETPLIYALRKDKFNTSVQLINLGADVKASKSNGNSALHHAVIYTSDSRASSMLLAKGAEVNNLLSFRDTIMSPLYYAVYYRKDLKLTQTLLNGGAKIDEGKAGWTPLMGAIINHDLILVQELLRNKPNLDYKGIHNWTALHFAARENQPEIIDALLQAGANKKIKDEWGRTPKKVASENELKSALKALRKS